VTGMRVRRTSESAAQAGPDSEPSPQAQAEPDSEGLGRFKYSKFKSQVQTRSFRPGLSIETQVGSLVWPRVFTFAAGPGAGPGTHISAGAGSAGPGGNLNRPDVPAWHGRRELWNLTHDFRPSPMIPSQRRPGLSSRLSSSSTQHGDSDFKFLALAAR
jgi:hypothetical protein